MSVFKMAGNVPRIKEGGIKCTELSYRHETKLNADTMINHEYPLSFNTMLSAAASDKLQYEAQKKESKFFKVGERGRFIF